MFWLTEVIALSHPIDLPIFFLLLFKSFQASFF
jgi:hypothetical protein